VQSLEGGIVKSIFVEEGQSVVEGQDLIKLDDVNAKASKEIQLSQLKFAKALEARLIAEQNGSAEVDFSDPILQSSDIETQIIVNNQKSLFELNRESLKTNMEMLDQRISQKNESINAYEARKKSFIAQQLIAKEQLGISKDLHSKGLEAKTRLLSFQDRFEDLDGQIHSLNAQIAADREAIAETEIQKLHYQNEFKQKNAEMYKQNRAQLLEVEQKLYSAEDSLRRTLIKAPTSGIVTGLAVHTIGAVIPPQGQKIMDIVPQDDELIVECYIDPKDL
jgi:HlyD family type I secretion membrane fusion protein